MLNEAAAALAPKVSLVAAMTRGVVSRFHHSSMPRPAALMNKAARGMRMIRLR